MNEVVISMCFFFCANTTKRERIVVRTEWMERLMVIGRGNGLIFKAVRLNIYRFRSA